MQIVNKLKNWYWSTTNATQKIPDTTGNKTKSAWQSAGSSVSSLGIKTQNGGSWLKKGLPLVAIIAVGFWVVSYFGTSHPISSHRSVKDKSMQALEANVGGTIEATTEVANSSVETEKATWIQISLSNGNKVEFTKGSFGHHLTAWLAGDDDAGTKTFMWDNLNFTNGSAELQDESIDQLTKIALVLKEYSWEQVIIEAHTDYIGNAAANKLLSQQRAESAKEWFVIYANIDATKMEAKGWGSDKWTASNDIPKEGMNSGRMDFVITKK